MIYGILALSFLLTAACFIFYFGCRLENKRQRKINALIDEMYLFYKNINDKESVFQKYK